MRVSASSLLELWTGARGSTWARCALLLADSVRGEDDGTDPETDAGRPEPIGRTVSALLRLRLGFAGDVLDATAVCPGCGEELEFALPVADLLALEGDVRADAEAVTIGGRRVRVRPPGFADLDALAGEPVVSRAEALARRCLVDAAPAHLDDEAVAAIEAAVEGADPLVEVRVGLTCPDCATRVDAELDVVAHVWSDVEAGARGIVAEVDALARAYGWSEADILALDDARRRVYLERLETAR